MDLYGGKTLEQVDWIFRQLIFCDNTFRKYDYIPSLSKIVIFGKEMQHHDCS